MRRPPEPASPGTPRHPRTNARARRLLPALARTARVALLAALIPFTPRAAFAQQPTDSAHADQSLADAWYTGPMLAASPNTLPAGHMLVEPYFYDIRTAHSSGFGTFTYALMGITDRLTGGAIIITGWNKPDSGPSSSGMGLGDVTLQATYRLTSFRKGSWVPITAVVFQETLPTGKFDQLGNRPSDGLGSGAYTSAVAFYAQSYYWLPNHRILRMRLNLTQSVSNDVDVKGVSVYGTGNGFSGIAKPGATFSGLVSTEYSISRSWVLAFDAEFNHYRNTRVSGVDAIGPGDPQSSSNVLFNTGPHHSYAFAPAIEYSWTPNIGVLLATRFIPGNSGTTRSVTPAIAINYVH